MPTGEVRAGSGASEPLAVVAEAVAEACGAGLRALLLSGSHAAGEAVWARAGEATVALSDLDLYAVVDGRAARDSARRGLERARPALLALCRRHGFSAPLEVAVLEVTDLERLPARPGTLELARHARVLTGDPEVLRRVPRWRPAEVAPEETMLLIENRAFELLDARLGLEAPEPVARLSARHAVLKVAVDLAGAAALAAGEWPDGSAARVAWGREHGVARRLSPPDGVRLDAAWSAALAWRAGRVEAAAGEPARAEWAAVAGSWCAAWLERGAADGDIWDRARRLAARAPLRRRLRRSLAFRPASGVGPGLPARLRFAAAGTPQHRVNASAGVLLLAAASADALPAPALGALRRLGVLDPGACRSWSAAARTLVRIWDLWLQGGQRGAGAA